MQRKFCQKKKTVQDMYRQYLINDIIDILIEYAKEGSPVDGIKGQFLPDEYEEKLLKCWFIATVKDLQKAFTVYGIEHMSI